MNTIDKVKFLLKPPFSSKIADLAENVRIKGPKNRQQSPVVDSV